MNAQRALKIINQNLATAIHDSDGDNPKYERKQISALKLAASAIEKQIPKKVIFGDDEQDDIYCPVCKFALAAVDDHEYESTFYKYCLIRLE